MSRRKVISKQTAQSIILKAIRQKVLILTEDDDTAYEIRTDIKWYIKMNMSTTIRVSEDPDGVAAAFMEYIYVMPLYRWNDKKRCEFDGLVLVTDENLKPEYIADGVKICRLPMIGE